MDLKDAPGIPARAVSEGTLLVTALLTATVWNQGADVLLIDELEADQVRIVVADDARGAIARRLSDHPRATEALQVLTTGEFLDAEGEDWVPDAAGAH